METKDRIIVALNVTKVDEAISLVEKLSPYVGGYRIGLELMSALLASMLAPPRKDESGLKKIEKLFDLLGHSIFKVLWFIESKSNSNGCAGIIFEPMTVTLIDRKGAHISTVTRTGDIIEKNIVCDYIEFGSNITKAPDPVAAIKKATSEIKYATRQRWICEEECQEARL